MTLISQCGVLGLAIASSVWGAEDSPTSIMFGAGLVSRYLDSGIQIAEESAQVGLEVEHGSLWYGAWANEPLRRWDRETQELQFYLKREMDLGLMKLNAGGRLYWFPELHANDRAHELEISAKLPLPLDIALGYAFDIDIKQHHVTMTLDLAIPTASLFGPLRFDVTAVSGLIESPEASYTYVEASLNMVIPTNYHGGEIYIGPRVGINDLADESDVWWLELGYAWFL